MLNVKKLSEDELRFILSDPSARSMEAIGIAFIGGEYYLDGVKITLEVAEDLADYHYITGEKPTSHEEARDYLQKYYNSF